tara:strand:- start:260 stop:1042 length:783 start_codon:yes stop_codon:yes gene_type:complete
VLRATPDKEKPERSKMVEEVKVEEAIDAGNGEEADAVVETPTETLEEKVVRLEGELAKSSKETAAMTQRLGSMQGNVRKQHENEAVMARTARLTEELLKHVSDPDADPEDFRKVTAEIKAQDATTAMDARDVVIRDEWANAIQGLLAESGMEDVDPRLSEASEIWNRGNGNVIDLTLLHQAYMMVAAEAGKAKDVLAEQKVKEARQRYNVETSAMDMGAQAGTPAAPSPSFIKVRDAYIENPNDPAISKKYNEMRQERGI